MKFLRWFSGALLLFTMGLEAAVIRDGHQTHIGPWTNHGIVRINASTGALAGLNIPDYPGDPTTLANGDVWYDTGSQKFRLRENGSSRDWGSGGGGGSATNVTISRTIWVDVTSGNDTTAQVGNASKPYATVQAAWSNITSRTKVVILPGNYTIPAKFGGSTGLNYPLQRDIVTKFQDVTNVVIEGWGNPVLQGNQQGTLTGISNVANLRITGLIFAGVKTNGILSNHSNNIGHLAFYGSNNNVTIQGCQFWNSEGFAIYGGDSATGWRTDNMRVLDCSGWFNGHPNFQGGFAFPNIPEGGFLQICGDNAIVDGCQIDYPARGIEWFSSQVGGLLRNCTIINTTIFDCRERAIFADALGDYEGMTVAGCSFRDGTNSLVGAALGSSRLNFNRVRNLVFQGNRYFDCKANMLSIGSGSGADTRGARIVGNVFDTLYRGVDLMDDSGAISSDALVGWNAFRRCTNFAIRVAGSNHLVVGNTLLDCGAAANNGAIWIRGAGVAAIRPHIIGNIISDSGAAWTTYGIRIEDNQVRNPYIDGNRILAYQGQPIWDGGSIGPFISQTTTNGWTGRNTGTNAPMAMLDLGGVLRVAGFTNVDYSYFDAAIEVTGSAALTSITPRSGAGSFGIGKVLTDVDGLGTLAWSNAPASSGAATNAVQSLGTNAVGDVVAAGATNLLFGTGSNVVAHLSNSPAGSVTIRIRTTGELNNWALFPTNTMNSNALNAVLSFASNQVRVTAGANVTVTPSGSGGVMTYQVAASGGSASTNNPVQAAGWLQVTQAISFVGASGTLVGTNMTYSNTLARTGSLFTNVFAANAGGVTNLLFDLADGSSIDAWVFPSNGVTARLPQFTAGQYVGNPSSAPAISSNAWNRIRVTRLNTQTNVEVWTGEWELAPGNMLGFSTNFASKSITVSLANAALTSIAGLSSTVFTNVPLGGTNISVRTTGGTNFFDTTGELNNWAGIATNKFKMTNIFTGVAGSADVLSNAPTIFNLTSTGKDTLFSGTNTFTGKTTNSGTTTFSGSVDVRSAAVFFVGSTHDSVTSSNGVFHIPTNGNHVLIRSANSNATFVTNIVGFVEYAAATPLFLDANLAHGLRVTNRISAATTVVITNSANGQEFNLTLLGEASGGAARVVTIVPHLGQLAANLDVFGTSLAATYTVTLTNGNAIELNSKVSRLNGTNIHAIVSRQFAF